MSHPVRCLLLCACVLLGAAPAAAQEGPPRKDAFGDPLPPHALARIGSARLRHGHPIAALLFSPDGKYLLSADTNGGVRLWDRQTAALALQLALEDDRPA